ncbi:MAG: serine/threonine-protein phosphatase [Proteobacteria bacterium]|nr:serine/threonine-protein phosphatase [Pseudomonadota bacterium]
MDLSWGQGTEQRLRKENQDTHGVFQFPAFTLAVVCDGMGGHVGGAQASALAVRTIHDVVADNPEGDVSALLFQASRKANNAIFNTASRHLRLKGMGTTMVSVAITDDKAYFTHVGDSRAYRIRQGEIEQVTSDHTMVNLFVEAELLTPEAAAKHPDAHVLARSLGVEENVDIETHTQTLAKGDIFLLCSDGVHGVLSDDELAAKDWTRPQSAVDEVLDDIAARNGDDNASMVAVILLKTDQPGETTPLPDPMARINALLKPTAPPPKKQKQLKRQVLPPTRSQKRTKVIAGGAAVGITAAFAFTASLLIVPRQPPPQVPPIIFRESAPSAVPFFEPKLDELPSRAPHLPLIYTDPPPGGALQDEVITALREHQCAKSLTLLEEAMALDPTFASLYSQVWYCFTETHQRSLASITVMAPPDFELTLDSFQGKIVEDPFSPSYSWEPSGGIEYRLFTWGEGGHFQAALHDILGEQTVADHLAADLLLEAYAAASFAKVRPADEDQISWWARRVYVASWGFTREPLWSLVTTHNPDIATEIQNLLTEAVPQNAPPVVHDAYIAGQINIGQ